MRFGTAKCPICDQDVELEHDINLTFRLKEHDLPRKNSSQLKYECESRGLFTYAKIDEWFGDNAGKRREHADYIRKFYNLA